jgi:hypothetical protein
MVEEGAEGDVADEAELHGLLQQGVELVADGRQVPWFNPSHYVLPARDVPVFFDGDVAVLINEPVPGRELMDALEDGPGRGDVLQGQEEIQGAGLELAPDAGVDDDGLELRAEDERPVAEERVVERLDAEPVSDDDEPAPGPVPDGRDEHPPQSLDEPVPPFLVGMEHGLGIGPRPEAVAAPLKLLPELGEVVDLAVVGRPKRHVLVREGLVAAGKVDDAQPPRPQPGSRLDVDALVVGAAVDDRPAHGRHELGRDGRAVGARRDAADPAHYFVPPAGTNSSSKKTPR